MNKKIKICIIIGVILLVVLIIFLLIKLVSSNKKEEITAFECIINDKKYKYEIKDIAETIDRVDGLTTNDKDLKIDYTDYSKVEWLLVDIKNNVKSRGGHCE